MVAVTDSNNAQETNKKKYIIVNDGYYLPILVFLISTTGANLTTLLSSARDSSPLQQTVTLQFASVLILVGSLWISHRCTDHIRFAPLMLTVYFQVDFFQLCLFLGTDIFSAECALMLLCTEVSSMFKNCGVYPFFMYLIKMRKLNPY